MTPRVSILVTVYNREAYLKSTVESILNSTYQNFEIIIVDDSSTDNSLEESEQIALIDKRVHVYANENNLGDYYNRNKAASLANGKYLKYLDADDLIYKHSLSTMVDAMEQFPLAALALSSNIIDPEQPYPVFYTPEGLYKAHFLGRSPLGVGPSAAIVRRECFESVGGFSGKQFVGDTELWMSLAERWPIVTMPPGLVWWRKHPGQQMEREKTIPKIINIRHELELEKLKATVHLSESQKLEAQEYLIHLHARRLWSLGLKRRRIRTACSLFSDSDMSISQLLAGLRRPPIR